MPKIHCYQILSFVWYYSRLLLRFLHQDLDRSYIPKYFAASVRVSRINSSFPDFLSYFFKTSAVSTSQNSPRISCKNRNCSFTFSLSPEEEKFRS